MVGGPKVDDWTSRFDATEMTSQGNAIKVAIASPKLSDLFNMKKWWILYKNTSR